MQKKFNKKYDGIINQKLKLFNLGKAISGAPISKEQINYQSHQLKQA
jgi:hypothetical protein